MEQQLINPGNSILKRFIQKQLIIYFMMNLVINSSIPYFSFDDLHTVYLFRGDNPLARFLLPMSLLLPFFTTFDILKKTIALAGQGKAGFRLPDNFSKTRYMLKMSALNAFITISVILPIMLCLHIILPENYAFNGIMLSILSGLLAGIMVIIFTLQPINKLKKLDPA